MLRCTAIAIGLLMGAALAVAAQTPVIPLKQQRQFAKLTAQAARQKGHKQAQTLAKIALLDYRFALAGFAVNNNQVGLQDLGRAADAMNRAYALLQAEAARGKTGGMKDVELAVQRMVFGLKGLAQQVDYTIRPKVQAVGSHFASQDAQILQWMFNSKN
jgi:hypothetical protein